MGLKDENAALEFNLLDNGIDFVLRGINELFEPSLELRDYIDPKDRSPASYKYGILHLFSGFLLLLKERLRRHLDASIFKGQTREVRRKIERGEIPNTVDLDEALERLALGPRVEFSDSELKTIRKIQNFRNLFEHYKFSASRYELWASISEFLVLIDRFLVEEIGLTLEEVAGESDLIERIKSIEAVWERIVSRKEIEWRSGMEATVRRFRRQREKALAAIKQEYHREKGAIEFFISCPECSEQTLIAIGDYEGICTNQECRTIHPITSCTKCGQATVGFYWEGPWCEDCRDELAYYMGKDD